MSSPKIQEEPKQTWRGHYKTGGRIDRYPVAFTRDSKYIFCCCGRVIKMYSVSSGKQTRVLRGHEHTVTGVAVAPKNFLQLYSISIDGTIRLWNYNDAILLSTTTVGYPIYAFCFHPTANVMYFTAKRAKVSDVWTYNTITGTHKLLRKTIPFCNAICIDNSGEKLVLTCKKSVIAYDTQNNSEINFEHSQPITATAIHPTDNYIAIGDNLGIIHLLHLDTEKKVSLKQWHHLPIGDIIFNEEGTQMITGGGEATLVFRQTSTSVLDFLPRLGDAAIIGITKSPDSEYFALRCSNNSIQLVNPRQKKIDLDICGVTDHSDFQVGPRRNHLVLNGTAGALQFYDPYADLQVAQVQVARPDMSIHPSTPVLAESKITHFQFSSDGTWLVTVDRKLTGERVVHLRFWMYHLNSEQYVVNTSSEAPHKAANIWAMAYHPKEDMCVTCSEDGKFKIWEIKPNQDPDSSKYHWTCRSGGFYHENRPISAAEFTPDGSMLALACQHLITLWDPYTNTLLRTLTWPPASEPVLGMRHVAVASNTWYLVAYSGDRIFVWNILRGDLEWSCILHVDYLAVDRETAQFVVFSGSDKQQSKSSVIMLMTPLTPQPLYCWYINHHKLKGLDFLSPLTSREVSDGSSNSTSSSIIYVDEENKINILQKDELDENTFDKNLNQTSLSEAPTVFQQMYADVNHALPPLEDSDEDSQENPTDIPKIPISRAFQDMFSGPAHALPPPLVMYDAFMDRLIRKEAITEKSESADGISNGKMELQNSSENVVEPTANMLDEVERETVQIIQKLSQQTFPQAKEQYEFLVDFFKSNFALSEQTFTVTQKVLPLPSHLSEQSLKKRKSSGVSPGKDTNGQKVKTTSTPEKQKIKKSQQNISRKSSEEIIKKQITQEMDKQNVKEAPQNVKEAPKKKASLTPRGKRNSARGKSKKRTRSMSK